jgi:hypothetical protein
MKRLLGLAALALLAGPALAADVGLSVNIGLPGAYGRVDIGGYPQPQLLYPQPVYVQRDPSRAPPPPIYLHVPPDHARHWRRHCAEYGACGQPVYFVQDNWYRDVYSPRYQEMQRRGPDGRDDRRGEDRGPRGRDDRGDRHDDRDGRGRN